MRSVGSLALLLLVASGCSSAVVTVTLPGVPVGWTRGPLSFQDGSAAWQPAPAPTGDTYELTIHSSTYAVGWNVSSAPSPGDPYCFNTWAMSYYFTVEEMPSFSPLSLYSGDTVPTGDPRRVAVTCTEQAATWSPVVGAIGYRWEDGGSVYCGMMYGNANHYVNAFISADVAGPHPSYTDPNGIPACASDAFVIAVSQL